VKVPHNTPTSPDAAVLERLFELSVRLTDAMDAGLAGWGMTRARAEVIWRLQAAGPMTQRELSQALRCTPRNVTDLVDALEAAGLVARAPHPSDRRATLVDLTAAGRAAADRMRLGHAQLAADLFADLPRAELHAFVAVLDRTLGRLGAGTEPDGTPDADHGERPRARAPARR
jgi:DNA-binding MarR family transcriptional regulator